MTARSVAEFDATAAAASALGVAATSLSDSDALAAAAEQAWRRLDLGQRSVIASLIEMGGASPAERLHAEVAEEIAEGAGDRGGAAWDEAGAAVEHLWEEGFIARARGVRAFALVAPVHQAFRPIVRRDITASARPTAAPAPVIDEHLLACAFNDVRREPIKLTRQGQPHARRMELLAQRLGPLLGSDPTAHLHQVIGALRSLGLVVPGEAVLAANPEAAARWAALDPVGRTATLVETSAGDANAMLLLRLLQELVPEHAWRDRASVRSWRRALLRSGGPADVRRDLGAFHVTIRREHDAALDALERAGLLVRDAAAGEHALTAAGRAFPDAANLERPAGFHVGPDRSVLVPHGLTLDAHLRLGAIARLETADVVARYRIDRPLVLEALDGGLTEQDVRAILSEGAQRAVPDSVLADVHTWCERFGEVSSHAGVTVACHALDRQAEFTAVVKASAIPAVTLAPGVVVVAPLHHAALCDALSDAGFLPRRTVEVLRSDGDGRTGKAAPSPAMPQARSVVERWDATPGWAATVAGLPPKGAAPAPGAFVDRMKEKYRREFGSAQLAALDLIDLDELMDMEERGRVRQYLEGLAHAVPAGSPAPSLEDHAGPELTPVSSNRARLLLEQAAAAGVKCQLAYLVRPGRTARLIVEPLEVACNESGAYLRARSPATGQERMIAIERIHALRVLGAKRV